MQTLEEWVVTTGWINAHELAAFGGVHESTISRTLNGRKATKTRPEVPGWIRDGLVVSKRVGRTLPPSERLLSTSGMLGQVYPLSHIHPVRNDSHDPRDHHPLLSEDVHQHPSYFNSKEGARFLFGRIEVLEMFYPLAPVLFQGEGAAWSPAGLPLRILSWRWVKHTRLIEAVATYEGNVGIAFCWVGQELTASMLRWRWENRFGREKEGILVKLSSGDLIEQERSHFFMRNHFWERPDPSLDFEPHLSGYVICGPDEGAIKIAKEVLPADNFLRGNAYAYAAGPAGARGSLRLYTGVTTPAYDDVADAFQDVDVDFPEDLCPDPNNI